MNTTVLIIGSDAAAEALTTDAAEAPTTDAAEASTIDVARSRRRHR
jgi:hypothetical protein